MRALDDALLQQISASDVAAVLIEPVLGEGGYVPPPAGFLQATHCSVLKKPPPALTRATPTLATPV